MSPRPGTSTSDPAPLCRELPEFNSDCLNPCVSVKVSTPVGGAADLADSDLSLLTRSRAVVDPRQPILLSHPRLRPDPVDATSSSTTSAQDLPSLLDYGQLPFDPAMARTPLLSSSSPSTALTLQLHLLSPLATAPNHHFSHRRATTEHPSAPTSEHNIALLLPDHGHALAMVVDDCSSPQPWPVDHTLVTSRARLQPPASAPSTATPPPLFDVPLQLDLDLFELDTPPASSPLSSPTP